MGSLTPPTIVPLAGAAVGLATVATVAVGAATAAVGFGAAVGASVGGCAVGAACGAGAEHAARSDGTPSAAPATILKKTPRVIRLSFMPWTSPRACPGYPLGSEDRLRHL